MTDKKPNRRMQYVSDLHVKCSLQVRNIGKQGHAASDNCNDHATSAVEMPNGDREWRCSRHQGQRWPEGADHPFRASDRRTGKVHVRVLR